MTNIKDIMDKMLIAVRWTDAMGTTLADATTLARLPGMIHAIRKVKGRVVGVTWLETIF